MGSLQPWHWLVIIVVAAFLFFGWKQLPDMARSFGRSLRVFKTEIKGLSNDDKAREENDRETETRAASEPRAIEPRVTTQKADVVKTVAPAAAPTASAAPAASRPRPMPSPNGRPGN